MDLKQITPEIREKLRGRFTAEAYSQHPTKTYLTTLKAMYIVERLNDVFGIGRWTLEHEIIKEFENQVLIKGKLVFLEYDINLSEQYGGHAISGKGVEIADGYKSAITDCISKSASYLEIGIDMFKGKINTKTKNVQNNTIPKSEISFKILTAIDVDSKWNGKIYKGKNVYIDNVEYEISKEQIEKLKVHKKYIHEAKK